MQEKVCLVTGANAGIGKATALGLAERDATVVMAARSRERGAAAQAEIKERSGNEDVHLLIADLASQAQIREMAQTFKQQFERLDVLINNAGIIPLERQVTEDGLEMQFAVNHLAYFLLTNLLLDVLKASAPARVVSVSSGAHWGASIDFDDLQCEKNYHGTRVYNRTKLMNILFTYELARRLEGTGVTANCLHPGVIDTRLYANYMGRRSGGRDEMDELMRGARMSLYLATSEEVAGDSGKYFSGGRESRSSEDSYNEEDARKLWAISAELT